MLKQALGGMKPQLLRCIGLLQRTTLIGGSTAWAARSLMALLKTTLKRCGCASLLPPKGILQH